jgi:hypothetical protein
MAFFEKNKKRDFLETAAAIGMAIAGFAVYCTAAAAEQEAEKRMTLEDAERLLAEANSELRKLKNEKFLAEAVLMTCIDRESRERYSDHLEGINQRIERWEGRREVARGVQEVKLRELRNRETEERWNERHQRRYGRL